VESLFMTDADQAIAAAQVLLPPGQQALAISQSYERWADSDRKAAETWLDQEADPSVRAQIKSRQLAVNNPSEYLASVGGTDDAFSTQCVTTALANLGYKDPGTAAQWLMAHPEQITTDRLSSLRMRGNPNLTITPEDIGGMTEGTGRDILLAYMTNVWTSSGKWEQAEAAMQYEPDTQKRDAMCFQIYTRMMQSAHDEAGEAAAQQWLSSQSVSDEVRASWEAIARSQKNQETPVWIR